MAWDYPKGYPQNREEAVALMMTIREEDIDLSDIPEITIPEGAIIQRAGDKFRKVGERNLAQINKMFRDYGKVKKILARERQNTLEKEHAQ